MDLHVVHILLNVTTYSITATVFPNFLEGKTSPQRGKFKWFVSILLISGGLLLLKVLQTFIQCNINVYCDVRCCLYVL